MEFLSDARGKLSADAELLAKLRYLEREAEARSAKPSFSPYEMRAVPAFLEPIGVFLEYNPESFPQAYRVFAKEVLLCANSDYLWKDDALQKSEEEHYETGPYWPSFRNFVANTQVNVAEARMPRFKQEVHRATRTFLGWLER